MKVKSIIIVYLIIFLINVMPVHADYDDNVDGSGYYANITRSSAALPGAVAQTPAQYKFTVEGQEFILLDRAQKNGKTYFFIMSEALYGTHQFSTATHEPYGWFNPEDTNNIAYWINNNFYNSGNGGKSLPDSLKSYITEWEWKTEALRDDAGSGHVPDGYKNPAVPPKANCKIALISAWEWKKYVNKIGYPGQTWFFRSVRTVDITNSTSNIICHTGGLGYNATASSSTARGIRPVFFIGSDFFANCKISAAGDEVIKLIDEFCEPSLYTDAERKAIFGQPEADSVSILGTAVVGKTLEIQYTYLGVFEEGNTQVQWMRSSTPGSGYVNIDGANKKEYIVTEADSDKYIKAEITPVSKSKKMAVTGDVAESAPIGPVIGTAQVNQFIKDIKDASAETVIATLDSHNDVFDLDTAMYSLSPAEKSNAAVIFSNADFSSIEELRIEYNRALALAKLNSNTDTALTNNYIVDNLILDLSRYTVLQDKTTVYNAITSKNYTSFAAFEKDFYEAVCLADISSADRTTIREILLAHKKVLGESFSGMTEYQLGLVGTDMLADTYSNFNDILAQLAISVTKAKNNNTVTDSPMISDIEKDEKKDVSHGAGFVQHIPQSMVVYEAQSGNFTDMSEAEWARTSVEALTKKGIISGYGDGTFCPNAELKREEFVKIVVSAFYPDTQGFKSVSGFSDTKSDAWYSMYIDIAVKNEIIKGISETEFGIGKSITREDVAVIICRIIGIDDTPGKDFADNESISDYAKESVSYLASKGVINGYENGDFEPKTFATRAMVAKIVYDILATQGSI
jgi:hypothetical protein